jgi:hypothetical protein
VLDRDATAAPSESPSCTVTAWETEVPDAR